MTQVCLNCGAPMYSLFDPCIDCGMRPTDPALRKGEGKEAYDREQGRHIHANVIAARSQSAEARRGDLMTKFRSVYSWSGRRYKDPGIKITDVDAYEDSKPVWQRKSLRVLFWLLALVALEKFLS